MRKRVGDVEIDTISAERPKFTAPVVFAHGLWCTSNVWHRLMVHLANRGWDCHAINMPGRQLRPHVANSPPRTSLAANLAHLNQVIGTCAAPPIVIGHDTGGLLAVSKNLAGARAIIALAPLLPAARRVTSIPWIEGYRARLAVRWRNRLPPPRGKAFRRYFGTVPPATVVEESGDLARELCDPHLSFTLSTSVPTLIVAGADDEITSSDALSALARELGADFHCVEHAGHSLPWAGDWERLANHIHRWLILTLGDSLLALLDEEEPE